MSFQEGRVAGLLTGREIEGYQLVEYIKENCLQATSCDLTVGDRHYLYESSGTWKAIFLGGADALDKENKGLPPESPLLLTTPDQGGRKLIIPPFGSAIIQLAETVDLLNVTRRFKLLVAGRFDLKLKSIYKGLISQQATQVEPCYRGKLYCFVHNLGAQEVVLEMGDTIATIEFSFAGQGLSEDQRDKIIEQTTKYNREKFTAGRFVYDLDGIKDIRWLYEQGMLPKESGLAPIYRLVEGNIEESVDKQLEKSDTVDKLAERVGNKLSERQNAIKIVISLVVAVITFFTTGLALEVKAELRYFSEELAFFAETQAPDTALDAIRAHTTQLALLRNCLAVAAFICTAVIVVLLLFLFFVFMRPTREQKWEHKRKALVAKRMYRDEKKRAKAARAGR